MVKHQIMHVLEYIDSLRTLITVVLGKIIGNIDYYSMF